MALREPEIKMSGPGSTNGVRVHQFQGSGFMNKGRAGHFNLRKRNGTSLVFTQGKMEEASYIMLQNRRGYHAV